MNFINRFRLGAGVNGAFLMLVGLMFIINPVGSSRLIIMIAGLALLFRGVSDIIQYCTSEGYYGFGRSSLVVGIIKVILGLYAVTRTYTLLSLFNFVVAIFVLITGVNSLENATRFRHANVLGWQWNMLTAVLLIICGILELFRPLFAASTTAALIGWVFLVTGINEVVTAFRLKELW